MSEELDDIPSRTRLARIRPRQKVWQDFSVKSWPIDEASVDLVFEATRFESTLLNRKSSKWVLVSNGFGSTSKKQSYGNGAIYVDENQIVFIDK